MKIIEKCLKGHSANSVWTTPGYSLVIQLKRVPENMLEDLLEYSKLYKDTPMVPHFDDESNPLDGVAKEKLGHLTPLDWEFLTKKRVKYEYLLKFLQVAQECGNKDACLMATNLLACEMKGLKLKELRQIMCLKSDQTRQDWEQISYENQFLIPSDNDSDPENDVGKVYNDLIINNVYDQLDLLERQKGFKHGESDEEGEATGMCAKVAETESEQRKRV